MEPLNYHEGKPSILLTGKRVVVLCPLGHVVEAMPVAEWAHSAAESRSTKQVRCCGS